MARNGKFFIGLDDMNAIVGHFQPVQVAEDIVTYLRCVFANATGENDGIQAAQRRHQRGRMAGGGITIIFNSFARLWLMIM